MAPSTLPAFVLAYHGCDLEVAEKVLGGHEDLQKSENSYDWLGHGIYFWEHNAERAKLYAEELQKHSSKGVTKPAVIGAVIDLGYCLNLLDSSSLALLPEAYSMLVAFTKTKENPLPQNTPGKGRGGDLLLRKLDCAVIEMLHTYREENALRSFDSVRGAFFEGKELYPNSGFKEKNHIQICVRDLNCIRAYFRVRDVHEQ